MLHTVCAIGMPLRITEEGQTSIKRNLAHFSLFIISYLIKILFFHCVNVKCLWEQSVIDTENEVAFLKLLEK